VILDELVLHDIGVFAGRNQITLTPPNPAKPVILIGGLNGAGKTTILDAIHLVLYGPLSSPAARRSGSYDAYLRSLIHHSAKASDGAAVELAFHAHHEGAERSYRIRRFWRETGSGIREQLEVLRDGVLDEALTATWTEHVEAFLPRGIAGLFFFDGEQIESLADLDQSRQVLGSALAALLGLELVDRLGADLAVLRRRRRPRQLPDEVHQQVQAARAAVAQARREEDAAEDARLAAQHSVDHWRKRYFELAEQYRAQGGEMLDQREPAEKRVASAHVELKRIDAELKEAAEGAAPMLMLAVALQELAARARRESEAARNRVVLDVLVARDTAVLEQLRSLRARVSAIAEVEAFLVADRAVRHRNAEVELVTGLDDVSAVEFLVGRDLPETRQKVTGLLARRARAETELDTAERMLAAVPDPEALAPVRAERDHAQDELLRAEAALTHAEERLAALRQQRTRAQGVYEKALDAEAFASLAADDDRRVVDHIDRALVTLNALKQAAIRRHLDRIASLMLEALRRLMRKQNLITEISIDPDTYQVGLSGSSGQLLTADQLSVGERQLLAVAMLWGLAHAAGQPLPVVIDTPLGRLDSSHRHHLVDRYFPQASHQVVLLSTDTEIDAEARKRLQRYISRAYQLDFDPAAAASTVRPGYFWEP
jgi:DNA sulfur modification protein DndD